MMMNGGAFHTRRKVTEHLNHWQTLVDALREEDRALRRLLAAVAPADRAVRGTDGTLSFHETLAHLAVWDDFTVRFFRAKLDPQAPVAETPEEFMRRSQTVVREAAARPFAETLALYQQATDALVAFVRHRWDALSERERRDFWVPVKHRRHHRAALIRALGGVPDVGDQEMASGA
jgi:hypothetical protein